METDARSDTPGTDKSADALPEQKVFQPWTPRELSRIGCSPGILTQTGQRDLVLTSTEALVSEHSVTDDHTAFTDH